MLRVSRSAAAALAASALLVASCSAGSSTSAGSAGPEAREYRPGLSVYPHVPDGVDAAPVVVMVPGGGWVSADPTGLGALADALAAAGIVAVPITIRAAQDGVTYPVPVEDVMCALAAGVAATRAAAVKPTSLVLMGHSSGAHLAAVAALAPDSVAPVCTDPLVEADALVGLAGPYDVRSFADGAEALFGTTPEEDPATWALADPLLLADRRPGLPVLLLHGDADEVVPVQATRDFAAAVEAGGHDTTVTIVPGADHETIYSADVAAQTVADWVDALAES